MNLVWMISYESNVSQVTFCDRGYVGGHWMHTNAWAMKVCQPQYHHCHFCQHRYHCKAKIALLSKLILVKWGESGKCVTLAAEGELMMRPCDGTLKQVKSVEQEKIEVN